MKILKSVNLGLRLLLELTALGLLAFWGWKTGSIPARIGLALAAPLAAAVGGSSWHPRRGIPRRIR